MKRHLAWICNGCDQCTAETPFLPCDSPSSSSTWVVTEEDCDEIAGALDGLMRALGDPPEYPFPSIEPWNRAARALSHYNADADFVDRVTNDRLYAAVDTLLEEIEKEEEEDGFPFSFALRESLANVRSLMGR